VPPFLFKTNSKIINKRNSIKEIVTMASRANIYIDQGSDFRISFDLFDADDQELGIATYDFFSSMKKMYSELSVADFDIEKSANNDVTLLLDADVTSSLKPGKYQYDVLMRKTTGEMSKIVEGLAFVVSTVTEV